MTDAISRAARFNRECDCMVADVPALQRRLDATLGDAGVTGSIVHSHPHLFSGTPVFLARAHAKQMQRVIAAVEAVTTLPAYREEALGRAPVIASTAPRNRGVFFGFDFHIAADGPKLIEINTNAGGALLNMEMRREQQACCEPAAAWLHAEPGAESLEDAVFGMFMQEWRLARGTQPLRTIAIVDDAPREQYLFPEFLLTQKLFAARGIKALIVDAAGSCHRCRCAHVAGAAYRSRLQPQHRFLFRRAAARGPGRSLYPRSRRHHSSPARACALFEQTQSRHSE